MERHARSIRQQIKQTRSRVPTHPNQAAQAMRIRVECAWLQFSAVKGSGRQPADTA